MTKQEIIPTHKLTKVVADNIGNDWHCQYDQCDWDDQHSLTFLDKGDPDSYNGGGITFRQVRQYWWAITRVTR